MTNRTDTSVQNDGIEEDSKIAISFNIPHQLNMLKSIYKNYEASLPLQLGSKINTVSASSNLHLNLRPEQTFLILLPHFNILHSRHFQTNHNNDDLI